MEDLRTALLREEAQLGVDDPRYRLRAVPSDAATPETAPEGALLNQ